MMLFLLEFLVSAADFELDIRFGSIIITGDTSDEFYNLKCGQLHLQMSKTDEILIRGTSPDHYVEISISDPESQLNLIFESFSISNENPAIFIDGECTVNITICDNVLMSSSKSDTIFINNNNSNLYLGGLNEKQILKVSSGANCSLIGGNGNVFLKNINFEFEKTTTLFNGFQGQIISLESCTINLTTYEETIGSPQTSTIIINSSVLYLNSEHSSCIGNSENSELNISIESSTVFSVTTSNNSPCIGNKLNSTSNYINIKNSFIKSSIESIESTFPVIGSSSHIQIESSTLNLEATKGSAIGGGQIQDLSTSIEIINSTITANSMGNSATIGGGEIKMTTTISITEHSHIYAFNSNKLGQNGAAIGGGTGTVIDSIRIENSYINCSSNYLGSAIGSGNSNAGSIVKEITIKYSSIYAENKGENEQFCSAGIGGNLVGFITIDQSNVTAKGGCSSAGIGGSTSCSIGDINIIQSNISATSMISGAAIGGSSHGSVNSITIIESEIDAFAGRENLNEETKGAGIGGGYFTNSNFITIKKSNVKSISGWSSSAAGIGGGLMGTAGIIEIENSHIIAISSLNSSLCKHQNNGGPGIGSGASTTNENEKFGNNGTIIIKNSFVSSYGSSIHTEQIPSSSSPLICGAAIGHGGSSSLARFEDSSLNILIENSLVFAYGGNATIKGAVASSAFLGGLVKNSEKSGQISIVESNIFSVPGHSVDSSSKVATSSFGWNFIPDYYELTGQLFIENSNVQSINTNEANNQYLSVVVDKFSLKGSSDIEFHSSLSNAIVSNDETFSIPLLTLSNLKQFNMSQLTIYGEKVIYERKIYLSPNDNCVSLSLPLANEKYLIRAKIKENEYDITDKTNEDSLFKVKNGNNFFNHLKVIENDEIISKSYTNNANQENSQKSKKFILILGLSIGITVAIIIIIACIITFIILRRRTKKDPLQIPAQSSDKTMTQPLNEQELESII